MEPSPSPTPEWSTTSPDEVPGTRPQPETEADPLLELYLQGQDAREAGDVERARRLWQEVVAQDPEGSYGVAAQAALGELPPPFGDRTVAVGANPTLVTAGAVVAAYPISDKIGGYFAPVDGGAGGGVDPSAGAFGASDGG
jgi:hypothetical protein